MGRGLTDADIRRTTQVVRQLSDDVKARSELSLDLESSSTLL
jgi:hypothetical protein